MTSDIVVLAKREPNLNELVDAMMAAGPQLRVGALSEGVAFQLFDDDGRLMLTMERPTLIQVEGEAERLLGVTSAPPVPYWWIELRAPSQRTDARVVATRLAEVLCGQVDGVSWASA
ncbi:MAG: hypothetical protein JWM76_4528 [Pseudonocardiales bacterium]|nr:hypothetical protein [Pseudonocardiales bacterium]